MQKYIHNNLISCPVELIATLIGSLGNLASYIQALKIYDTHSAADVSLLGNIIVVISMVSWLWYGLLRGLKPLIITNIIGLIGTSLVIWGIIIYG